MSKRDYIAVIQAGGKGTRMVSLTKDLIPKPMLEINGKPMLLWQMENASKYGIKDFIIIVGHLGEKIEEYFGDGSKFGYYISYIYEKEPLGSAGALYYIKSLLRGREMLLIFGDVMFEIDIRRFLDYHEEKSAIATLLAHPNSHPYDSDLLIIDEDGVVRGIDSKNNKRNYYYKNIVNAGIYLLNESALDGFDAPVKKDLEKDVLEPLMRKGKVYGYVTPEYVKDAGTIDRFAEVTKANDEGVWERKCLSNKQTCIFLDRDGTINKYAGLIAGEEQLVLEENSAEAIRLINQSGMLAIVITNQPVVARGMCSIDDVKNIHNKLETLLGENGAYLDDIVFCPHHPDKGYPEENPAYKIVCNCRKPKTGMIDAMVEKYNIDISKSYMIGDTTMDIKTGNNAGLHTILVATGEAGQDKKYDVTPDFEAIDLLDAVNLIIDREQILYGS